MNSIGVDIVYNNRFLSFINDERKLLKILSSLEMTALSTITHEAKKLEYIASRFCAKEALYKAGIKEDFNQISILNDLDGKPYVSCKTNGDIQISISHEKDYSIAFVVINGLQKL